MVNGGSGPAHPSTPRLIFGCAEYRQECLSCRKFRSLRELSGLDCSHFFSLMPSFVPSTLRVCLGGHGRQKFVNGYSFFARF